MKTRCIISKKKKKKNTQQSPFWGGGGAKGFISLHREMHIKDISAFMGREGGGTITCLAYSL